MTKYINSQPWRDEGRGSDQSLFRVAVYKNSSDKAVIEELKIITFTEGERDGFVSIILKFSSQFSVENYEDTLPQEIRDCVSTVLRNNRPDRLCFRFTKSERAHVTTLFSLLNALDPLNSELRLDLRSNLGIPFSFSNAELNQLIEKNGVEEALLRVKKDNPRQLFVFAKTYKQLLEQKEEMTEKELFSLIYCYQSIDENNEQYKEANQAIYDLIMGLELDAFSKEAQFHLRGNKLKSAMKLGNFDEVYYLLPALCGYGLSEHPFPKMTGRDEGDNKSLDQNELLNQMICMAEDINTRKEEIKDLKAENDRLRNSHGFFKQSVSFESKDTDESKNSDKSKPTDEILPPPKRMRLK